MKAGEKTLCPHCGERSVIKEKKIFDDDFSLKGIKLCCALCGGEIKKAGNTEGKTEETAAEKAAKRLSDLLGGETIRKVHLEPEADDGHFCLHCKNYIKHPFMNRCALTMQEVEATDSCKNFSLKDE